VKPSRRGIGVIAKAYSIEIFQRNPFGTFGTFETFGTFGAFRTFGSFLGLKTGSRLPIYPVFPVLPPYNLCTLYNLFTFSLLIKPTISYLNMHYLKPEYCEFIYNANG
jgi:hypothetical protein